MTPDLRLATSTFGPKVSASPKSGTDATSRFADALGDALSKPIGQGSKTGDGSKSVKDRLHAALLESLKDNDMFKLESAAGENNATSVQVRVDGELISDDATQSSDPDTDAEAEADEEKVAMEIAPPLLSVQQTHQNMREMRLTKDELSRLPAGANAIRGNLGEGAEQGSEQPGRATSRLQSHLETQAGPSRSAVADQVAPETQPLKVADGGGQKPAENEIIGEARLSDGKAEKGNVIPAARQEPVAKTASQMNVQVQLITTDPALPPAQAVAETIKTEPSWSAYFRDLGTSANQPVQSLKIQLHPAELGTVTAHMRAAGDALEVEITADTAEAHRHLTAEADEILRSLRQVGIEVDRITVHLADNSANANARNGSGEGWRDFSSFSGQERRESENARQERSTHRNGDDSSANLQTAASRENPAPGRYI